MTLPRDMLLVLDNAEHLPAIGDLAGAILAVAPRVRLLVTSRERLAVPGEWVVELGGLAVPADTSGEDTPAMVLFRERAR